jgi:hypothetical protein
MKGFGVLRLIVHESLRLRETIILMSISTNKEIVLVDQNV